METEMDPHTFKCTCPINAVDVLDSFRRAFDGMAVQEGADVFLFSHFM